jgi:hypothetical protein
MSAADGRRRARIGEIVSAVARQMLEDRRAERLVLLDDGSPEADLAAALLTPLQDRLHRLVLDGPRVDSVLHAAGVPEPDARSRREAHRMMARLVGGGIVCAPASKTDLLLDGELPPEAFLPLGDLWASEVEELGGWRGSVAARELAEAAGGVGRLDDALRAMLDARDAGALSRLPPGVAERVRERLAVGAPSRVYPRLVPKLGSRTIGVDLLE